MAYAESFADEHNIQESIRRNRRINERDEFYSSNPASRIDANEAEVKRLKVRVAELETRLSKLEGGFEMVAELASEDETSLVLVSQPAA